VATGLEQAARVVTPEGHFFAGYYDIPVWDETSRFLLALKVPFMDHEPAAEDVAEMGVVDARTGAFEKFGETTAWNFQQGCFLQWLPEKGKRKVIYNVRGADLFGCVVKDLDSGAERMFPFPVGGVSNDGRYGLTLNFSRLHRVRPGYGYAGVTDRYASQRRPETDGVGLLDLATGQWRLALSVADAYAYLGKPSELFDREAWFNHVAFNTTDTRFSVLYRWRHERRHLTEFFAANLDGSDLRRFPTRLMTSHYDWRDEKYVLAFARMPEGGDKFWLFPDGEGETSVVADGVYTGDGHCCYSHDRKWFLNDTYPDENKERSLFIYNVAERRSVLLGKYDHSTAVPAPCRCDLHPKWSPDDRFISFDSIHEGRRAVYVVDVSKHTRG